MSRNQRKFSLFPTGYHALGCRTVAQIQRSAVEPNKRNPISRLFYARKDEATIAAWRSDLDRILRVFEVRSTVHSPPPRLLTVYLQTELALHTNVAVSDVRQDVANTHGLVSDIHRAVVKGQEATDIRNQGVCIRYALFTIKNPLQLPRLKPGLQFQL